MSEEGGVWRTVGGRRIFIKDGEDLTTAMKNSGKFNNNDNNNNKDDNNLEKVQKEIDDYVEKNKDDKIRVLIVSEILDKYGYTKAIDRHLVSVPNNTANEIRYNYDNDDIGENKTFEVHLQKFNKEEKDYQTVRKIKINKID